MHPESLPPALSDLFLTEAATPGTGSEGRTEHGSDVDVDRFEQYLSSARRSVTAETGLPGSGAGADRWPARADASSRPLDAINRADRSRAERDDRRPIDDRPDRADRRDPGSDQDRADAVADDRRVDDGDRRREADAETGARSDDTGDGGPADDGEDSAVRAEDEHHTDDTDRAATDGDDPTAATDGSAVDTAPAIDGSVTLPGSASADEGGLATMGTGSADGGAVLPRQQTEGSGEALLDTEQDRTADPMVAAAIATATATGSVDDGDAAVDDLAIDLDGGARPDLDRLAQDVNPVDGDESPLDPDAGADLDLTGGDGGQDGDASDAGDAGQHPDGSSTDQAGDEAQIAADAASGGGQASTEAGSDAGQPVAPVAGSVATTSSVGPTGGVPSAGLDAVAGPTATSNRTTTGTTSTQAGHQAQAPLTDGEAGDPLWLQVRRAMGSLRTLQNGDQQMTVRLRPAELGSVMVRVNAGDAGTTVSLIADSAVAATQLTQQRQQLISELEQGGLSDVAVDVGTGAETDLRDEAADDDGDPSTGAEANASAAAAVAGASLPRTGGRGRRTGGSSGSLVDVDL